MAAGRLQQKHRLMPPPYGGGRIIKASRLGFGSSPKIGRLADLRLNELEAALVEVCDILSHHHHHHLVARSKSIAVSTMRRQEGRSVARRKAE